MKCCGAIPSAPRSKAIEFRPSILRAAHAVVDVLNEGPAAGNGEGPEGFELVLRVLLRGAHPRVQRRSLHPGLRLLEQLLRQRVVSASSWSRGFATHSSR